MRGQLIQRYLSILFLIRGAYFSGRAFIICRSHPALLPVLDILSQHGFIRSYEPHNKGRAVIIWTKGTRRVEGISSPALISARRVPHYQRNPASISCALLKRISRSDGSALFVLNTDRGLLTHLEAIRLNVGGNILFRIV